MQTKHFKRIMTLAVIALASVSLTGCGHSNTSKQAYNSESQSQTKTPVARNMNASQKKALLKRAINEDFMSAQINTKASAKINHGKKTSTQTTITKFSEPNMTVHRLSLLNGKPQYEVWSTKDKVYAQSSNGWLKAKAGTKKGRQAVRANQKLIRQALSMLAAPNISPHVSATNEDATGVKGMTLLQCDVTITQRSNHQPMSLKEVAEINRNTGELNMLSLERGNKKVKLIMNFTKINSLNDLRLPKKISKTAKNAQLN